MRRKTIRATAIVRAIVSKYKIPHERLRGGTHISLNPEYVPVIRLLSNMGKRKHPKALPHEEPRGATDRLRGSAATDHRPTQPPTHKEDVGFTGPSTQGAKEMKYTTTAVALCKCLKCGEKFYDDHTQDQVYRSGLTCPFCGAGFFEDIGGRGDGR